ncbi:MAG: NHL repeat-containing protein [Bacteroidetes bacterium]|nr:NHL repeat-containing protein [Bacteroidota bacterium]
MKQQLIIITALILLIAGIGYLVIDLFYSESGASDNPYAYGLNELRKSDSSLIDYQEIQHFPAGLSEVYGIAADPANRIYVTGANGVEIYSPGGEKISEFSFPDTAYCIAVTPDGNLLLGMVDHIEIMTPGGEILSRWKPESEASVLTSVATDGTDIFVADAGKKIVYRYDREGTLLNRIGKKDSLKGIPGFVIPSPYFDLGIGRDDELWVVNSGRHLFEAFRPDGSLISTWGKTSTGVEGFCGCCNPSNFAMLSDGSFVTSEKGIERVKVYLPSGEFKCLVAAPDQFDQGTRGIDLAVDSEERILVLDPWRNQIRIFIKKGENNDEK